MHNDPSDILLWRRRRRGQGGPSWVPRLLTGRVDFVGLGDSNQIHGGFGWDHGFQFALDAAGYPMHATGLITQNEGNGSGANQGWLFNRITPTAATFAYSGAPSDQADYLNKGSGALSPADYAYIADGGSASSLINCGMILSNASPLDVTAALEFDCHWVSFNSGSGAFRPSVRLEVSPFTTLAFTDTVNTNLGAVGPQKSTVAITADPTRSGKNIGGRFILGSVTGITGPFFSTYMRFRNPARSVGWSYSTLDYRGGQSARTVALDLQEASDATLSHYFKILRDDQGANKTIVIVINGGLNDRNETLASVGPAAVSDGDSAAAFVDNIDAIVIRIKEIWTLNGWSHSELFWVMMPSHPVSAPDDAELTAYRAALSIYCASLPQSQMLDLSVITPQADYVSNSWYASGGSDKNHLVQAGYEQVSVAALAACR